VRASVPKFVGVSVSRPKRKKRAKRVKFLNFFRFWLPFLMFFRLFVSLFTKKRKFFFTPVRRKSQSLSFASRASEYTHTHKRPSSWYVLRRRYTDDDASVVLCILFVFVAFISLSLSLLSRVIEDFLINRERESTDFFFASSPSIFKM